MSFTDRNDKTGTPIDAGCTTAFWNKLLEACGYNEIQFVGLNDLVAWIQENYTDSGGGAYTHIAIDNPDYHLQPTSPCIGAGTVIAGITTDIEGNQLYPPYNIAPYGLAAGALGVAPIANDGAPRNNITRLTGTSTTIDPADTYILADTQAARVATGFVYGVDHWAYNSDGTPKTILGSVLIANGGGNQFFCGVKRIAGYSTVQVDPALTKIKRLTGV